MMERLNILLKPDLAFEIRAYMDRAKKETRTEGLHGYIYELKRERDQAIADLQTWKTASIPELTCYCAFIHGPVKSDQCETCKHKLQPIGCVIVELERKRHAGALVGKGENLH